MKTERAPKGVDTFRGEGYLVNRSELDIPNLEGILFVHEVQAMGVYFHEVIGQSMPFFEAVHEVVWEWNVGKMT